MGSCFLTSDVERVGAGGFDFISRFFAVVDTKLGIVGMFGEYDDAFDIYD